MIETAMDSLVLRAAAVLFEIAVLILTRLRRSAPMSLSHAGEH